MSHYLVFSYYCIKMYWMCWSFCFLCMCVCLCERERETYPLDWLHVHCGHSHIFPALRCCRPLWPQTPHWLLRWHTQRLPHGCLTHKHRDTHTHTVTLFHYAAEKSSSFWMAKQHLQIKSVLKSKWRSQDVHMQELVEPTHMESSLKMSQYFKMKWDNPHQISFWNSPEWYQSIYIVWGLDMLAGRKSVLASVSFGAVWHISIFFLMTRLATMSNLTLGDHFAKHRHGLQSGAVPSTVAKLELTLIYSQLCSTAHRIHHLHAALTDLNLEQKHTGATSATDTLKCFTFSWSPPMFVCLVVSRSKE